MKIDVLRGGGDILQLSYIKGVAIISVILIHLCMDLGITRKVFYNFWIGQAVPLFITISCLLGYISLSKNDSIKNYFEKKKIIKTFSRIFVPFVLAQIFIVAIYVYSGEFSIRRFLTRGGLGPGSYYPWLYIQLWVAIPFMFLLMKKNAIIGTILILLLSIGTNVLFSILNSSLPYDKLFFDRIYRLVANRYLFIFPLVYLLLKQKLNCKTLLLFGFIGAVFMFYIQYGKVNWQPVFYKCYWTVYGPSSHFYTILLFVILYKTYEFIPAIIQNSLIKIGRYSWEIFCVQMIWFSITKLFFNLTPLLHLVLSLFICIVPVITYKFMKKTIEIKTEAKMFLRKKN